MKRLKLFVTCYANVGNDKDYDKSIYIAIRSSYLLLL